MGRELKLIMCEECKKICEECKKKAEIKSIPMTSYGCPKSAACLKENFFGKGKWRVKLHKGKKIFCCFSAKNMTEAMKYIGENFNDVFEEDGVLKITEYKAIKLLDIEYKGKLLKPCDYGLEEECRG